MHLRAGIRRHASGLASGRNAGRVPGDDGLRRAVQPDWQRHADCQHLSGRRRDCVHFRLGDSGLFGRRAGKGRHQRRHLHEHDWFPELLHCRADYGFHSGHEPDTATPCGGSLPARRALRHDNGDSTRGRHRADCRLRLRRRGHVRGDSHDGRRHGRGRRAAVGDVRRGAGRGGRRDYLPHDSGLDAGQRHGDYRGRTALPSGRGRPVYQRTRKTHAQRPGGLERGRAPRREYQTHGHGLSRRDDVLPAGHLRQQVRSRRAHLRLDDYSGSGVEGRRNRAEEHGVRRAAVEPVRHDQLDERAVSRYRNFDD